MMKPRFDKSSIELWIGIVSLAALLSYTLVHTGGLLARYVHPAWVGYIVALGVELSIVSFSVGRIVSREELRQDLWPDDTFVDFDHSINTAMQKLRCALSDSPSNPRFVRTVPRRGYRFIAPVEFVGQQPSQDILNRSINGLAVMCAGVADFFTNGLSQTRDNDNPAAWPEET
jgi:hypothetical protein